MYRVTRRNRDQGDELHGDDWHLAASRTLDADAFRAIAAEMEVRPIRARKIGCIAARRATMREHVQTVWNGKETESSAAVGDWIVTALAANGEPLLDSTGHANIYVIKAGRFPDLYEAAEPVASTANGDIYRPRGVVEALRLRGGFEIAAPWGEMQRAPDGWLVLNGRDVYGNQAETFAATYAIVG